MFVRVLCSVYTYRALGHGGDARLPYHVGNSTHGTIDCNCNSIPDNHRVMQLKPFLVYTCFDANTPPPPPHTHTHAHTSSVEGVVIHVVVVLPAGPVHAGVREECDGGQHQNHDRQHRREKGC